MTDSGACSQVWQRQRLAMTPTRELKRAARPFLQDTTAQASDRGTLESACRSPGAHPPGLTLHHGSCELAVMHQPTSISHPCCRPRPSVSKPVTWHQLHSLLPDKGAARHGYRLGSSRLLNSWQVHCGDWSPEGGTAGDSCCRTRPAGRPGRQMCTSSWQSGSVRCLRRS